MNNKPTEESLEIKTKRQRWCMGNSPNKKDQESQTWQGGKDDKEIKYMLYVQ